MLFTAGAKDLVTEECFSQARQPCFYRKFDARQRIRRTKMLDVANFDAAIHEHVNILANTFYDAEETHEAKTFRSKWWKRHPGQCNTADQYNGQLCLFWSVVLYHCIIGQDTIIDTEAPHS